MRELVLVRHAKSDWGDPLLADHDRPLNARGRKNAPMMALRLAESGLAVQRILSSTAVRARSTAAVLGAQLGLEVELDPELYLAPASKLLTKAVGLEVPSAMLVAHDPGLSDLASLLSAGGIAHMPTCAVAHFAWNAHSWDSITNLPADRWSLDTPRREPSHPGLVRR